MAFTSKFCFWCSVRLGAILTAIFTLIQGCAFFGVVLFYADSLPAITDTLNALIKTLHLEGGFYKEVAEDPKILIMTLSTFFGCLICSCVLLLYGCYQCKTPFMYPFIFFYLLYIIGLFGALLLLLFYIKVKGDGLGDLILYSSFGGSILLFYLYTWSCVLSLIQIIKELQNRLKKKLKVVDHMLKLPRKIIIKSKNSKNKTMGFQKHAHFN